MNVEFEDIGPASFNIPKYVGGWNISGSTSVYKVFFAMTQKPNWFHRFTMKLILGWIWEDTIT